MDHKLIILGMMCVTMIPRIVPFFAFKTDDLPPVVQSFLGFIPYTVLGALILPGGFGAIAEKPLLSSVCLAAAIIIAWFKGGIIGPVLGAVTCGLVAIQFNLI